MSDTDIKILKLVSSTKSDCCHAIFRVYLGHFVFVCGEGETWEVTSDWGRMWEGMCPPPAQSHVHEAEA